jgi:hypothetical protein
MNRYVTVITDTAGNQYVYEWDGRRTAPVKVWIKSSEVTNVSNDTRPTHITRRPDYDVVVCT